MGVMESQIIGGYGDKLLGGVHTTIPLLGQSWLNRSIVVKY